MKEHGVLATPKGKRPFECWGWSNVSAEDARRVAREKAERLSHVLRDPREKLFHYGYGTRPLREEVLREIKSDSGETIAALTRNQYGCIVLNTTRAMFVDIDFEGPELPQDRQVPFLFFFGKPKAKPVEEIIQPHLQRIETWSKSRSDWSWRVYRTRAGLRLLATHKPFAPAEAAPFFDQLGADPLYAKLCTNQNSFRARLTPKPWRVGLGVRHVNWPWPSAKAETAHRK